MPRSRGLTFSGGPFGVITDKKFLRAIESGDVGVIRKGMKTTIPLSFHDDLGRNALHLASLHGMEKSVRVLLELGVDPGASDKQKWTPLHAASSVGQYAIGELLVASYKENNVLYKKIDQQDCSLCTALHLACMTGCLSLVRTLVAHGADINIKNKNNKSPQEVCNEKGDENLAKALASTHESSRRLKRKLATLIVEIKKDNVEVVVASLKDGVPINTVDPDDGLSLLYISACSGAMDVTYCLLGRGADINARNEQGRSIVHQLVLEGIKDVFDVFLSQPDIDVTCKDNHGRTILHSASEWGRKCFLASLIEHNANINEEDSEGCHPIHICAKFGRLNVLKELVEEYHIESNLLDRHLNSPLHHAAKYKRIKVIEYLLSKSTIAINGQNEQGKTPLHLCCEGYFSSKLINKLLECGANPDLQDNDKNSPLLYLVKWQSPGVQKKGKLLVQRKYGMLEKPLYDYTIRNHMEMCSAILRQQSDVDICDGMKRTALHWAILHKHMALSVQLIHRGSDFSLMDKDNITPLYFCVQPRYSAKEKKIIEATIHDFLVNENSKKQHAQWKEQLFECATQNQVDPLSSLLSSEFQIVEAQEMYNEDRESLLQRAIRSLSVDFFYFLLEEYDFQKVIHKKDSSGNSLLHIAASMGCKQLCTVLLPYSDVFALNLDDKTSFDLCLNKECKEILQEERKKIWTKRLLDCMTKHNEEECILLLDNDVDFDATDEYGCSLLTVSCIEGLKKVIEKLVKKGANLETSDENIQTALHWAVMKQQVEGVQLLLGHKANVDCVDTFQRTPLHWAVLKTSSEIVSLLMSNDANPNTKDGEGQSPIDIATGPLLAIIQNHDSK